MFHVKQMRKWRLRAKLFHVEQSLGLFSDLRTACEDEAPVRLRNSNRRAPLKTGVFWRCASHRPHQPKESIFLGG